MKVLLCSPLYFDVPISDSDNLHMNPKNRPNVKKAIEQHSQLTGLYDKLGLEVYLMPPVKGLVDMTFAANSALVIGKKAILSNFKPKRRQGEVIYYRQFLESLGYKIYTLPDGVFFEGVGDALPYGNKILCGYGFRTSKNALPQIEKIMEREVIPIHLVSPGKGRKNLYHFDTTSVVLEDVETLITCREALTKESLLRLEKLAEVVPASYEDAANLALNAVVVPRKEISESGVTYLLSQMFLDNFAGVAVTSDLASQGLKDRLRWKGYTPIGLDLSEFLKSGGGALCLTSIL